MFHYLLSLDNGNDFEFLLIGEFFFN